MSESIHLDDVLLNKMQSIQRCIARAREEYGLAGEEFATDTSRQDAAVLNIIRACEQAIDLANHVIRLGKMGIPQTSADSFVLLAQQSVISQEMAEKRVTSPFICCAATTPCLWAKRAAAICTINERVHDKGEREVGANIRCERRQADSVSSCITSKGTIRWMI